MNEERLSYVYSFKCGDDIKHLEKLSDQVQSNIERYIVQVISESFVKPGDEDYITARLLAQKGMHRAFFWAASQAVEKYLKAFLLMRGASVNEIRFQGHPIGDLFHEACSVDEELASVDTNPHSRIKFHPNVADSFDEISVARLINDLEAQGSPDNRYNSFGVSFSSGYLFALDSFAFGLRQLIGVPPIQETLRKLDQSLVETFYFYNPWFAQSDTGLAEIPNENFKLRLSDSVTTLEQLISTHSPYGSRYALQWLDKKMKLPGKVKRYLRGV
ncbi:HEPN domain-containing protein [Aromatoleum buckelii]|uniref:HEPN domain-containing protein n=1 Tax=Aromatoleum buckelii TaxID=200254 RepID=A0ABX1N7P7_9RHOO|nr:HEPN domain-containing protein [Aromatoleum buckelii]MCK0509742.1 HEPN domain-containing protein [Aromatoleum buckelii]